MTRTTKHRFIKEFQEISHCGGRFTVEVRTTENGQRGYQLGISNSRPNPAAWFAIYALPMGIPVGTIQLGGIGTPWNPAPFPECYSIFIGSDSLRMFGHECGECGSYWRSNSAPSKWSLTCPYCGLRAEAHDFLTTGQRYFVEACCELINNALNSEKDGEYEIDMDKVADAAAKGVPQPEYYYAEESQQNQFSCQACGDVNDILGRYGYCGCCGTHNGMQEVFEELNELKERVETTNEYESCVKHAVSAFDSYARKIVQQLSERIPMTPRAAKQTATAVFPNLNKCEELFYTKFDIKIFGTMKQPEREFSALMFHRRHVYEHNGGEVDERYIRDSGDTTVKLKQSINENKKSASRLIENVKTLVENLHSGFHLIFPPENEPVQNHQRHLQLMEESRKQSGH